MEGVSLGSHQSTKEIKEEGRILIQIGMTYPVITGGGDSIEQEVNACMARWAENLVDGACLAMIEEARAAQRLLPDALPFRITLHHSPTYHEHGILSYFSDLYLFAGGRQGATYRYGNTLRLRDGAPLFVTAFFPTDTDVRKVITGFIAHEQDGEIISSAAARFFTPENVYLTEGGLAAFFQPHVLGPGAGGVSVFTMPYGGDGPFSPARLGLPERP